MDRQTLLEDFTEHLEDNYANSQICDWELDIEIDCWGYDCQEFKPIQTQDIIKYLENHGWSILYSE